MEKLFLGIAGYVVCINKNTGEEIWSNKIKSGTITSVYFENGCVFAYSGGHLFRLNASTGEIEWENPLKGYGYGACIIASEQQANVAVTNQEHAQQAAAMGAIAAAGAASTAS